MSIESVLEEITALRNDIKTLSKIVRKVKAKQDDPNGEKAAKRAESNGFNRKQVISEKLRAFLELPKVNWSLEVPSLVRLTSTSTKRG